MALLIVWLTLGVIMAPISIVPMLPCALVYVYGTQQQHTHAVCFAACHVTAAADAPGA